MKKFFVICLLSIFIANGAFSGGLEPSHLSKFKITANVSISDNGQYVAYLVFFHNDHNEEIGYINRELYVYDTKNKTTKSLNTGESGISSVSWVPNSNKIAFTLT